MWFLILRRLAVEIAIAFAFGFSLLKYIAVSKEHFILAILLPIGMALLLCGIIMLPMRWLANWYHFRSRMNDPTYFEAWRSVEEQARNLCEMDLPPNEDRLAFQWMVKKNYDDFEKYLQQYIKYHQTRNGAVSETHIERGLSYVGLLGEILELRKRALIQVCDKFKLIPPQQLSRWNAMSYIVNEFDAIECSIGKFYKNGWKEYQWKQNSTSEKPGDMITGAEELGELYEQSIAKADDLMSWLAYHDHLMEPGKNRHTKIFKWTVLGYKLDFYRWKPE